MSVQELNLLSEQLKDRGGEHLFDKLNGTETWVHFLQDKTKVCKITKPYFEYMLEEEINLVE